MMTLIQFPLSLRFSVRMLCLQVFFIAVFISSQTPFSYSDSTIFISEDSYLYVESPVDISDAASFSGTNNEVKKGNITQRKAFCKLYSSTSKNHINPSTQTCSTVPKSSHYVGNFTNPLSTAVLGNPSPVKQHQKMMGSALRFLLNINSSEKKLLCKHINHFNLLEIITNHFSRPPPIMAIFY
ncbi:hypothetical protein SAMN05421856_101400 [Chryseobacterium taichungense]|uniref:Uncharacterized protein n=1 Tax=Chryseobacterium taichungense TaxID=295069 RepID=A0A1H7W0D8_9FLAO|nr:hypothetical protein [Chryseobacterium taichungense]SEM14943.1 hypothetical protein SAMN05421856_101400 [Chryseobacterium taichungense]